MNDTRCPMCPDRLLMPDGRRTRVCLTCGYMERRCGMCDTWIDVDEHPGHSGPEELEDR